MTRKFWKENEALVIFILHWHVEAQVAFFVYITFFFQAYHSIAKCVAALAMSCPADRQSVVNQFVKDIQVLLIYFANLLFFGFFEVRITV